MNNFPGYNYLDAHMHRSETDLPENDIFYIVNSIHPEDYAKICEAYKNQKNVLACWGIHPRAACSREPSAVYSLYPAGYSNPLIGECGLDFHWITDSSTWNRQIDVFREVIRLCEEHRKIPCIHTKGAEKEVLNVLKQHSLPGVMIHWYSGPVELIQEYINLGCHFTIGPDILKHKNRVWNLVPKEKLLLETDSPGAFKWVTGKQETTGDIKIIYRKLAAVLDLEMTSLQNLIHNNFKDLFSTL